MDIRIISNCTHAPIKEYLAATGLFRTVDSTALYTIRPDDRETIYDELSRYDFVIAWVHGEAFGKLYSKNLKAEFGDKCALFTTPFFNGLHPDMIHVKVGDMPKVRSPLSDYHSGLMLWGYLTGTPIDLLEQMYFDGELPELFEAETYWQRGVQMVKQRDESADIASSDIYADTCLAASAMLTFNHPSMLIISKLVHRLLDSLGIGQNAPPLNPASVFNPLMRDVAFPVSPAAIRLNDLSYATSPIFRCGLTGIRPGEPITFREFAEMSYSQYAEIDMRDLTVTTPGYLGPAFRPLIDAFVADRRP